MNPSAPSARMLIRLQEPYGWRSNGHLRRCRCASAPHVRPSTLRCGRSLLRHLKGTIDFHFAPLARCRFRLATHLKNLSNGRKSPKGASDAFQNGLRIPSNLDTFLGPKQK
jgi:hypothetical protein